MFTGIIQHCGTIKALTNTKVGARISVSLGDWDFQPALGDSIAVNGCCLTVANAPDPPIPNQIRQCVDFDVIHQTLNVTSLSQLAEGDRVNLEHAVTAATLMSGHVVQGHVDGIGTVTRIMTDGGEWCIRIAPPAELMQYMVSKGSVAIDGVSLTIAELDAEWIEVALIPTTLRQTNLDARVVGDQVNLEADYFARILVSWLERRDAFASRGG